MLLPRYSIRTALAIVTVVAVLSLFAGQALGGRAWALGLTVAALTIPAALAVHGAFFAIGMAFSRLLGPEEVVARTNRGGVERSRHAPAHHASHTPDLEPPPAAP